MIGYKVRLDKTDGEKKKLGSILSLMAVGGNGV